MSHSTLVRTAIATLLLGCVWLAFTQQRKGGRGGGAKKAQAMRIEKVRGNLHVIYGAGGNIGVLATSDGVVLIDDKFDRMVAEIVSKVETVSDKPVRYVLNTHHHGDHSGGNPTLMKTAEIVAHENARANMVRGSQPGVPNLSFSEQLSLDFGGAKVRAFYFGRGHTSGDAVVYFPDLRVIHTGDLFVRGAPFIDYGNGGSSVEWDDTLNSILQLEFDTVIPGHGRVGTREDLVQWKEDYETFRSRIGELSRQNKTPDQVAKELDLSDLNGWSIGGLQMRSLEGLLKELR